jgi:hypothetical protein
MLILGCDACINMGYVRNIQYYMYSKPLYSAVNWKCPLFIKSVTSVGRDLSPWRSDLHQQMTTEYRKFAWWWYVERVNKD